MGYNITVMFLNDAIDEIASDAELGQRLRAAVQRFNFDVAQTGSTRTEFDAGQTYAWVGQVAGIQHSSESRLYHTHGNLTEDVSRIPDERFPIYTFRRELERRGYTVTDPEPARDPKP